MPPATPTVPVCTPKSLPEHKLLDAAAAAVAINPSNRPFTHWLLNASPRVVLQPQHIAVLTTRMWPPGQRFGVAFLDNPGSELANRILSYMNKWADFCNVGFAISSRANSLIRVARTPGQGYWSYLGTDLTQIPNDQQTMNLDSWTLGMPATEWDRVICHETGHSLGCPHEHLRREIVAMIDEALAIQYFWQTQGWNADMVRSQVLTPLDQSTIMGTASPEVDSIMCYQLVGDIMKNRRPILGGSVITPDDGAFMAKILGPPLKSPTGPTPPPPPPPVVPVTPSGPLKRIVPNGDFADATFPADGSPILCDVLLPLVGTYSLFALADDGRSPTVRVGWAGSNRPTTLNLDAVGFTTFNIDKVGHYLISIYPAQGQTGQGLSLAVDPVNV